MLLLETLIPVPSFAHSGNKYLFFSFAPSLPRGCAPRRRSLEACCQKPPTPSQSLPTPPKEMVPAASQKSSPPQGQVSVGSGCHSLLGVVVKPPRRHGEYGQGTCTGGSERAGDATEAHTLVISSPYLQALPRDHLSKVQQTGGQIVPGPVREQCNSWV